MALKIKKWVKQPDGTSIEVEGTEAEVEAYERKLKKKNESLQKKKEILHGKAAKALKKQDVMDELKQFIAAEIAKLNAVREVHHWYFNNGWWWRPYWYNGQVTYYYSQTQPNQNNIQSVYTCTNTDDFQKTTGIDTRVANNGLLSNTLTTTAGDAGQLYDPNMKFEITYGTGTTGKWSTSCYLTQEDLACNATSPVIKLNSDGSVN